MGAEHDSDFEDEQVEIVDLDDQGSRQTTISRLTQFKTIVGRQIQHHGRLLFVSLILLLVLVSGWRLIAQLLPAPRNNEQARSSILVTTVPPVIENASVPYAASNTMTYVIKADGVLYALQSGTGQTQWSYQLTESGTFFLVSSGQVVYRITSTGDGTNIAAYQGANGELLWQEMEISQHVSFQPMIQDDIIYMEGDNGTIYAIQGSDGRLLWHFEPYIATDASSLIPMATLVHLVPGIVSIRDSHDVVHILHAYSGIEIAYYEDSDVDYANWRMFVDNGILYFSASDLRTNPNTQSIYAYGITSGTTLWQKKFSTNNLLWWGESSGKVFVDDGTLRALRASDSMQQWEKAHTPVLWLAANSSALYIETPDHIIHALNRDDMHEIWQHTISANVALLPVLFNGILYFGPRFDMVEVWSATSGQMLWQDQEDSPLLWYPSIVGDIMYIQTVNNILLLVHLNDGSVIWSYKM